MRREYEARQQGDLVSNLSPIDLCDIRHVDDRIANRDTSAF